MNTRLLVWDDEPAVVDAYQRILKKMPAPAASFRPARKMRIVAAANAAAIAQPSLEEAPGFDVCYVKDGKEALGKVTEALIAGFPFAGGFFDVKFNEDSEGIDTLRKIRDLDVDFLFVIVTRDHDRIDELTEVFGHQFADRWDFLTKPLTPNEIRQKARNMASNWDRRKRERDYLQQIQRQQELLVRQERLAAMGTLARGIGHEFGNILLRIIGKAEIAREKADVTEMKDALTVIASAAERAGLIVRNLNGLVRMETSREWTDVHCPLQDSLELMEHELTKGGIRLIQKRAENLPKVLINRVEMGQVFLNLLINATHALEGRSGGEIRIETVMEGTGVQMRVSDTGCGIPPEIIGRIFEPLFTTKAERGTGIGLSVSRKIIGNHNGRLTVKSEVGKGTCFTLWLPGQNTLGNLT